MSLLSLVGRTVAVTAAVIVTSVTVIKVGSVIADKLNDSTKKKKEEPKVPPTDAPAPEAE